MSTPRTICTNCAFCLHKPDPKAEDGKPDWFDYRCQAVVNDKVIDPVTGGEVYRSHEAGLLTTEKHPNCRDMNQNGECPMYQEE